MMDHSHYLYITLSQASVKGELFVLPLIPDFRSNFWTHLIDNQESHFNTTNSQQPSTMPLGNPRNFLQSLKTTSYCNIKRAPTSRAPLKGSHPALERADT